MDWPVIERIRDLHRDISLTRSANQLCPSSGSRGRSHPAEPALSSSRSPDQPRCTEAATCGPACVLQPVTIPFDNAPCGLLISPHDRGLPWPQPYRFVPEKQSQIFLLTKQRPQFRSAGSARHAVRRRRLDGLDYLCAEKELGPADSTPIGKILKPQHQVLHDRYMLQTSRRQAVGAAWPCSLALWGHGVIPSTVNSDSGP
jgi:hypothetical protein